MKTSKTITALLFVIILANLISNNVNSDSILSKENAEFLADFTEKQHTTAAAITEVLKEAEVTMKALKKLQKALVYLGPPFMIASTALSILALATDEPESPELTAIKDGFQKVESEFAKLNYKLGDLEKLISYKAVESNIQRDLNIIDNLYDFYQRRNHSTKQIAYFKNQFTHHYNFAARNLWLFMVSQKAPHQNIFLDYAAMVKCNPKKLLQLATSINLIIDKGMTVEGYFYAADDDKEGREFATSEWKRDMKKLDEFVNSVVDSCEKNYEKYAKEIFDAAFKASRPKGYEEAAAAILKDLTEGVPQRKWGVWLFDDSKIEQDHYVYPTSNMNAIDNGRYASASSLVEERAIMADKKTLDAAFDKVKDEDKKHCDEGWFSSKSSLWGENVAARRMTWRAKAHLNIIGIKYRAIKNSMHPVYKSSPGRGYTYTMTDSSKCIEDIGGMSLYILQ